MPKERAPSSGPSMGKVGTRKSAPQRGSVEASNLHGEPSAETTVLPKRSDSPKGTSAISIPRRPLLRFVGHTGPAVRCHDGPA